MSRRARGAAGGLLEDAFQAQVIGLLRVYGWRRIFHAPDNRPAGRTGRPQRLAAPEGRGFPDVLAIHETDRRLLVAELKAETGRERPGQREWLEAFAALGAAIDIGFTHRDGSRLPTVEAYLWRPSDWDELHDVIRGRATRRVDLDPPPALR